MVFIIMKKKFLPKMGDNKMTWSITHKITLSIADILVRFADSIGVSDIHDVRAYISTLSPEQFSHFKFNDSVPSSINADFDAEFDDPDSVSVPSLDSDLSDSEVFE